ncbi:ArsR family transcriptional regulator [Haloarcula sp. Atlit-7R]|nr:ArsR family transcriptional regulator [Haloarcula sp. Atlit-7R]
MSNSTDEYFSALADIHRRRVLVGLLETASQQGSIAVPEDVHDGHAELESLQAGFHHVHLPRLKAAGLIRQEQGGHEVMKGPNFDEVRPVLETMRDRADALPNDCL